MSYAYSPSDARPGWLSRALGWMDDRAPISWIAATVAVFTFGGPLGLLVLGFALFTGRFRWRSSRRERSGFGCGGRMNLHLSRPTGNRAFDSYKSETIARLEREQEDFEAFLIRLREARDKAEFDQYMEERARAAATPARSEAPDTPNPDQDRPGQ
ncbi:DUF2852 domain-containing protein [Paenirhodobacter populi]|nr:DUF2852 domain-containing protein [Sinirhodobacter populi]